MDKTTDYSAYSLDELVDARANIDTQADPENSKQLDQLITLRRESQQQNITEQAPTPFTLVGFHGKASEYFSIWIVNLLLSIVTLGIYSAWAKVRTQRYFYSNLDIDGHRLSYLGEPLQILKGRILGLLLFGGYFLLSAASPQAGLAMMLVLFLLSPLLICLSIRFKMKMTAYRNVRLNFNGRYGEAFVVFLIYPLLSLFTLYLAMPWALKKMDQFIYANAGYGNKAVETNLSASAYYAASFGAVIIAVILFAVAGFFGAFSMAALDPQSLEAAGLGMAQVMMMLVYVLVISLASSYYTATVRNHLFGNTAIPGVAALRSSIEFVPLAGLTLTNLLALVVTLGFALPWIKIRTARFMAAGTAVAILPGIDDVIADSGDNATALGDEVSGLLDIDVSLG